MILYFNMFSFFISTFICQFVIFGSVFRFTLAQKDHYAIENWSGVLVGKNSKYYIHCLQSNTLSNSTSIIIVVIHYHA